MHTFLVVVKVVSVSKGFGADGALEGPLVAVDALVFPQVTAVVEFPSTVLAFEGIFVHMNFKVSFEAEL